MKKDKIWNAITGISLAINVYFLLVLLECPPFVLGGGRVIYLPDGSSARLTSIQDLSGWFRFYRLSLGDEEIKIKTKHVAHWGELRETKEQVLYHDVAQDSIIWKIPATEYIVVRELANRNKGNKGTGP